MAGELPKTDGSQESACRHCRLLIPEGATLCYKCGSYQNWRRHLSFSTSILALLVALLSVASTAVPAILKSLDRPSSNLIATNAVGRGSIVKVTASNLGSMPGIVKGGHIELGSIEENGELWASITPAGDTLGLLVSGRAMQLTFHTEYNFTAEATERLYDTISQANLLALSDRSYTSIFTLALFTHTFDNKEVTLRVPLGAHEVLSGLREHYQKCRKRMEGEACWHAGGAQVEQAMSLLRPYGRKRANLTPLAKAFEQEEAAP